MSRRVEHYLRVGELWPYRTYGPGETIALDDLDVTIMVDNIYTKVHLRDESSETDS